MSKQRLIIALFTVLMPLIAFSQEVDEEYGNIGGEASQLTFPNAFSPNGDGNNELYQAKTCQNIVKAKGADGKDYHIRKDVNLLRGHSNQNR